MRCPVALLAALLLAERGGCLACESVLHTRYDDTLDCSKSRDMCSYTPVLRRLASRGSSVVEMGVRGVVSTWALMLGLVESAAAPLSAKWMISIDIQRIAFSPARKVAGSCGLNVSFIQHDSATVALPPTFDLLFIDTMHTRGHLRRELAAHADRTRQYIVLHDTIVDGTRSDIVRMRGEQAVARVAKAVGYSQADIRAGLQPALDEFLVKHPEWTVLEHYTAHPGLTVLTRHESIRPGGVPFFAAPSRFQRLQMWLG
jgi:hypothetical protein